MSSPSGVLVTVRGKTQRTTDAWIRPARTPLHAHVVRPSSCPCVRACVRACTQHRRKRGEDPDALLTPAQRKKIKRRKLKEIQRKRDMLRKKVGSSSSDSHPRVPSPRNLTQHVVLRLINNRWCVLLRCLSVCVPVSVWVLVFVRGWCVLARHSDDLPWLRRANSTTKTAWSLSP